MLPFILKHFRYLTPSHSLGRRPVTGVLSATLFLVGLQANLASGATGDMKIEHPALGSTIKIETSARFAGSVTSIVFRGKQFVDARDHGRELQSASSFDGFGECFNPTEAGSRTDGDKQTTSSKLLATNSGPDWLATSTDMAFWLPPGFDYGHQCGQSPTTTHAVNTTLTGHHILDKRITIGDEGQPNVISDHVTYTVPEAHVSGTFEAATVYTPVDFSKRYILNLASGNVEPTTAFGEQDQPVILATEDGNYAIGLFSPLLPQGPHLGYGSFTFRDTNKLNCVFREKAIAAGQKFNYVCDIVVGSLAEVKTSILQMKSRHLH